MYFTNGFPNFYEEIKTYYPRFYDDVLEMDAIWQADGKLIDDSTNGIDLIINNNLIATADSETLTRWEQFLGLATDYTQSLEMRRQTILTFMGGSEKLSGSALVSMIKSLTGADAKINFNTQDSFGNFILTTTITNSLGISAEVWANIFKLYQSRLPAHIATQFGFDVQNTQNCVIAGTATISMNYGG
jgi:hypothetical protein